MVDLTETTFNTATVAIIVTYHPDLEALGRLLKVLSPQVNSIVIIDNGSSADISIYNSGNDKCFIEMLCLGENRGIAAAQNVGIQWARDKGAEFVLLMDQDSIPMPDMVSALYHSMLDLRNRGIKVVAVGPRFVDERNTEHSSFIGVTGLHVNKIPCLPNQEIVETDTLISSGSLISLQTLSEVGGPLDELFIDQVDLEWCFRAKSREYLLFGVCNAILLHSLGEMPKKIFGRTFINHGPLRHYYIFRNAVWLLFKKYTPVGWKLLFIRMMFVRLLVYSCMVSPRRAYLGMMLKGIWHGLRGRMGKFDQN